MRELSKLEQCVTQYEVTESITRALTSLDLFDLARASKTTWTAIHQDETQWNNLVKRSGDCDGYGLRFIGEMVEGFNFGTIAANRWIKQWHSKLANCGARKKNVETKPCENCGRKTCNEGRLRTTYGCFLVHGDMENQDKPIVLVPVKGFLRSNFDPLGQYVKTTLGRPGLSYMMDENEFLRVNYHQNRRNMPKLEEVMETDLGFIDIHNYKSGAHLQRLACNRKRNVCYDCIIYDGPGLEEAGKAVKEAVKAGGHECHSTLQAG